jgi:thioesterase domain-containing protein
MVHGRTGIAFPRADFLQSLAEGQKLRMFELPGLRGGRSYDTIEDIAGVYVAQLLDEYPRGPILLASFCAGGLIALEMADQLAKMGRPIHHLVLLDPPTHAGSLGRAGASALLPPPRKWMNAVMESLLPASVVRRRRELKYRELLTQKMLADPVQRAEWADLPFSTIPRARLSAAYSLYRPKPYRGSVTLLSSRAHDSAFQAGSNLAKLLPQLRVELVAKTHSDIDNPDVGRAMQKAFDAALGREGTRASYDRQSSIAE